MTKRVTLSQEIREELGKVRWEFAKKDENHSGKEIRQVVYPVRCTSLYLSGAGVRFPSTVTPRWWHANDGAPRCSRPLRKALLKACGLKEPR